MGGAMLCPLQPKTNKQPHLQLHSPWYNCTGWLGVKYQLTYLLTATSHHRRVMKGCLYNQPEPAHNVSHDAPSQGMGAAIFNLGWWTLAVFYCSTLSCSTIFTEWSLKNPLQLWAMWIKFHSYHCLLVYNLLVCFLKKGFPLRSWTCSALSH